VPGCSIERERPVERLWIDHLGVFNPRQGLGLKPGPERLSKVLRAPLSDGVGVRRKTQSSAQGRCRLALFRAQVGIARAQGQSVRLPHGGADANLDRKIQVVHETLHHGHLLRVLLPEIRSVGLDRGEELGDHRRHAIEVTRAGGALERF